MSWVMKPLGSLSKIMYGYTESASIEEVGPRFLRITDIQEKGVEWSSVPYCKIAANELKKYRLASGDIVFARTGATTGKSFLVADPPESVFASYLIRVQINQPTVLPEYLNLYFQTPQYWDKINEGVTGSAQGGFNATKLGELNIPIPPLPEQQRIVGKLDAAFAALTEAQAHVERNRANARELFESYLNGAHAKHEKGWKQTTLGAEVEILTGYPFKSKQYTDSATDVKLLRGDNIVQGSLRWEDVKRWPANDIAEYERYWMLQGDVVLAMDRTWVKAGLKYASLGAEDLPCLLVQRTACLRCGPNLDKQFLRFLIGSKDFTNYVITVQTGIGVPHISGGQISAFKFFLPSLDVQRQVAKTLSELEFQTKQLETTYQQKLSELAGLKKAVLGAAFRGEL